MSDDEGTLKEVRGCLRTGDYARARELLMPMLEQVRSATPADPRRLVGLLLLYETAVAEASTEPSEKSLDAVSLCEEAIAVCEAAGLDASVLITALTRASTRCVLEDPKRAVEFSRKAVAVALERSPSDVDVSWLRMHLVGDLLKSGDNAGALAEVESWPYWELDDIQLWLVAETLFRAGKANCVPLLERFLRDQDSWDSAAVAEMQRMVATARAWPRSV